MSTELSKMELVALGKVVKEAALKTASSKVPVGKHSVDFTVRVMGEITKGEDYDSKIVAKADFALLFAVALSHLNAVTVESIVRESLTADPALVESLKIQAAEAVAKIKKSTNTHCNGKITTQLNIELIESIQKAS